MTFSISLNFDSTDDLQKFLNVLKEGGFDKFIKKTKYKKPSTSKNREWKHLGIGNLKGDLDNVNMRDYAYEE